MARSAADERAMLDNARREGRIQAYWNVAYVAVGLVALSVVLYGIAADHTVLDANHDGIPDKPDAPDKSDKPDKPDGKPDKVEKVASVKGEGEDKKAYEWEDTDNPTYDQIQDFQKVANKAGVPLTEAEAEEALKAGAFTKGENTYKILRTDGTPTEFKIEKVGKTNPLDDLAPNFDEPKPEYAENAPGAYDPTAEQNQPTYEQQEYLSPEQILQEEIDKNFGPGGTCRFLATISYFGVHPSVYFGPVPYFDNPDDYDAWMRVRETLIGFRDRIYP